MGSAFASVAFGRILSVPEFLTKTTGRNHGLLTA